MADASLIELRAGQGDPRQISLTPGSVLDPTSVGQTGMWRVEGSGVLDVHGYLYFDGKALFVQSADDETPVMVNRHRVARAWTEVRMPSTIELGEVQLVYRIDTSAFEDADQTVAQPLEDTFEPKTVRYDPSRHRMPGPRPAAGTPAEGVQAAPAPQVRRERQPTVPYVPNAGGSFSGAPKDDNESTRYKPIEAQPERASQPAMLPGGGESADVTRMQPMEQRLGRAAGAPPGSSPARMSPPPGFPPQGALPPGMIGVSASGGPGSLSNATPPPQQPAQQGWGSQNGPAVAQTGRKGVAAAAFGKINREFNAFSPVKKVAVVAFVFAILAGGMLVLSDDTAEEPVKDAKSASSASAVASASQAPPPAALPPAATLPATAANLGSALPQAGGSGQTAAATPVRTSPVPPPAAAAAASASAPPVTPKAPGDPPDLGKTPAQLPPLMTAVPMPLKKSPERQAADAVVEGKFAEAAKLYDELATTNPSNPAYKEAARIMRDANKSASAPQ